MKTSWLVPAAALLAKVFAQNECIDLYEHEAACNVCSQKEGESTLCTSDNDQSGCAVDTWVDTAGLIYADSSYVQANGKGCVCSEGFYALNGVCAATCLVDQVNGGLWEPANDAHKYETCMTCESTTGVQSLTACKTCKYPNTKPNGRICECDDDHFANAEGNCVPKGMVCDEEETGMNQCAAGECNDAGFGGEAGDPRLCNLCVHHHALDDGSGCRCINGYVWANNACRCDGSMKVIHADPDTEEHINDECVMASDRPCDSDMYCLDCNADASECETCTAHSWLSVVPGGFGMCVCNSDYTGVPNQDGEEGSMVCSATCIINDQFHGESKQCGGCDGLICNECADPHATFAQVLGNERLYTCDCDDDMQVMVDGMYCNHQCVMGTMGCETCDDVDAFACTKCMSGTLTDGRCECDAGQWMNDAGWCKDPVVETTPAPETTARPSVAPITTTSGSSLNSVCVAAILVAPFMH